MLHCTVLPLAPGKKFFLLNFPCVGFFFSILFIWVGSFFKPSILLSEYIWPGTNRRLRVSFFQQTGSERNPAPSHPLLIITDKIELSHHWPNTCESVLSTALIPAENEFGTRGEYAFAPCNSLRSTEARLEAMGLLGSNCATSLLLQHSSLLSSPIQGKETTVVPKVAVDCNPSVFCEPGYCHCHSILLELVERKRHGGRENRNVISTLS